MLFKLDWDKAKIADPFQLDTLIAWLKRRRPEEEYYYESCFDCLLAQYFHDHYYLDATLSKNFILHTVFGIPSGSPLPKHFNWIAEARPRTFGAALLRAELAMAEPKEATKAEFAARNWLGW